MTEFVDVTATVGHDYIAESTVLAACLNNAQVIARARRSLTPESFWNTAHTLVFAAMIAVDDRQEPCTPLLVFAQLQAQGQLTKLGDPTLVHTLYAFPWSMSASFAINAVAKLDRQRKRAVIARRFAQIADEYSDPDLAADAWARASVELEAVIDDTRDDEPVPGVSTWTDFLASEMPVADEVVPGLLDKQEAVMILAGPGVGKSWLSRQAATTIAAGRHPFHPGRVVQPKRTLLVDLENPKSTVHRQMQQPYANVSKLAGRDTADRGWFWTYPAGLNIRKRPDAALLERVIDDHRPDLVCVGSLYNLFQRGSADYDTAAEETIAVLNRLRAKYGCAWWIEHHMPRSTDGHRQSPFGSTLWERWPSYGRVINRIGGQFYEFAPFRGDREAGRDFPVGLRRGGERDAYSWEPIWDAEELEQIRSNFPRGAS